MARSPDAIEEARAQLDAAHASGHTVAITAAKRKLDELLRAAYPERSQVLDHIRAELEGAERELRTVEHGKHMNGEPFVQFLHANRKVRKYKTALGILRNLWSEEL